MLNTTHVGDVNSNELGSGARFNSGKPDMSLWPMSILATALEARGLPFRVVAALHEVSKFQFGGAQAHLFQALKCLHEDGGADLVSATRVLEYGRNKYAQFNWAKGMAWSICIACIGRHALAMISNPIDEESGQSHIGHIEANILFLIYYYDNYKQGDDRWIPPVAKSE